MNFEESTSIKTVWLVTEDALTDRGVIDTKVYFSENEALAEGKRAWDYLTKSERKTRTVGVYRLDADKADGIDNNALEDNRDDDLPWYDGFMYGNEIIKEWHEEMSN